MSTKPISPVRADRYQPGQGLRTCLSFLLFVYLFSLAVQVFSGSPSRESRLLRQMKRVTGPCLAALMLESSHEYPIVTSNEVDDDHFVVFDIKQADGSELSERIGGPETFLSDRRQRFVRLAKNVAQLATDDQQQRELRLPLILGGGMLRRSGAEALTFNCYRYEPLTEENVRSSDAKDRDPLDNSHLATVSKARVWLDGDTLQINKIELAKSDSAPLLQPETSANPPVKTTTPDKPKTSGATGPKFRPADQ